VAGGWCGECGRRLSAARDRAELELDGIAAVTDRARRRHNEDAVAIGRAGDVRVAVVCDGISTARRADAASTAAAEAGLHALLDALTGASGGSPASTQVPAAAIRDATATHLAPDPVGFAATPDLVAAATTPDLVAAATTADLVAAATVHAASVAAKAAADTARAEDGDSPPGCTYVSAVVTDEGVTVGWIGDSRAYWVGADGDATQLTVDDSLAAIHQAGLPAPDGLEDMDPESRALVRWLGADAGVVESQVVRLPSARPGLLIVCTDGLSHYLPTAADLAAAVAAHDGATPLRLAAELTALAIRAGGHDNIAVAVLPVAASEPRSRPATPRSGPATPQTNPATPQTSPATPPGGPGEQRSPDGPRRRPRPKPEPGSERSA
jgi:serine/threonine protein phosphatase PrpC